jgi:oligopeptide transport system substrate-binding protein
LNKYSRRFSLLVAMLMVASLFVGAVGAQDDLKVLNYPSGGAGDLPSMDPALAEDTTSIQMIEATNVALTRLSEEVVLEPGLATSWEVSEDGLVYTYYLRDDVPWVRYDAEAGEVVQDTDEDGNVRMVTANDFVYGIKRSVSADTGSYYGGLLAKWIAGAEEFLNGEADADAVQVVALDDYTLQITATKPAAFLENIYGMWMAMAQPQWVIEEYGDFWTEAENVVSNGPFVMKEWLHGESMTLVANPFWPGADNIPVPEIDEIYHPFLEASAQLANYEAGTLDIVQSVPLADVDRILADPILSLEYVVVPGTCTYYYAFNSSKAPLDDVRVRQALSLAIDRQDLIDNVLKGGQGAAWFFTRPEMVAAPLQEDYPDFALGGDDQAANDAAAQELMNSYLADNGGEIDTIILGHNESEAHAAIASAIQEMWAEVFGDALTVEIQTQEWAVYLDTRREDETAFPVYRLGWCYDYTDANNWLYDVWNSEVGQNAIGDALAVTNFDELTNAAITAETEEERRELYAEAEYLLTNEAAVVAPIYYYTSSRLTKPYVERTYAASTSQQRFENWDINR